MEWFFGYSALIENWTKTVFYSAIFLFLLFSGKNHNIRWLAVLMLIFVVVDSMAMAIFRNFPPPVEHGWVGRVYNIVANLFLIKLIFDRPFIAAKISGFVAQNFTHIAYFGDVAKWLLPPVGTYCFYRQEAVLIKVIKMACVAQLFMIAHYVLYFLGATKPDGALMMMGLDKFIVFQVGYAILLLSLIIEVVVLVYLIIEVVARRLVYLSKGF